MNLTEIGCAVVDWIHVAKGRVHWRVLVNEPSSSIKGGELIHQLRNSQLLKKDTALWRQLVLRRFVTHTEAILLFCKISGVYFAIGKGPVLQVLILNTDFPEAVICKHFNSRSHC
jgi:hypothetical protein